MADDVTITVHVRDLSGPGFNSVSRNLNQLQRQANGMGASLRIVGGDLDGVASSAQNAGRSLGKGGGLTGQLIGVGAALGASVLPAIGSLAPMLAGLGVVGGGAALAMDDLKKKAKQLKPAFEDWQKATEKAVAPHTERAVKSLKSAMKDLEPSLVLGAETFGTITERASAFAASPAFQSAFQRNAQMGVVFVEQFAESVGKFTQSFFEFGAKSQPSLDAMQELLGGFLDTGLPGMFDGLEQGIGGSARVIEGLASFLNEGFLPALGKVAGSFAEAFGPLLGEILTTAGEQLLRLGTIFEGAMEGIEPLALIAADAWHAFSKILDIGSEAAWSLASALGGALFDSLLAVLGIDTSSIGDMAGGFTKLTDWVDSNEGRIRGVFFGMSHAIIEMVSTALQWAPKLYDVFSFAIEGVLVAMDGFISTLAHTWGDLPGMGFLKDWNSKFDEFAGNAREDMRGVGSAIDDFVGEAVPRLSRAQLKLSVDQAEQNLASIKEKLDDPSLTKTREAKLRADKKQAEQALADAKAALKSFDRQSATGTFKGNVSPFMGALGQVRAMRIPTKTGAIRANTSPFWAVAGGLNGRTIGSAFVNVYNRYIDNKAAKPFRSAGGPVRGYADGGELQHFPSGGLIEGPGGPRSDSILATFASGATARVSDTEYVVQSSAVKKYGLPLLNALNRGALKLAGGGTTKGEREARSKARSDLTLSRFGYMAGWRTSEFGNALSNPDSISSLVSALNSWRSIIQKATHGRTESRLLKQLDSTGKKLMTYERQLDKASSSLQKSKDRLNELKQAAEQLRSSIMNGVLSAANITKNRGDGPVTPQSIMANLIGSRDQASAFASALKQLQTKGVKSELIQQIAEAGIEGGGLETAGALLKASRRDIIQMNLLQTQIMQQAALAGKTTSDSVYSSRIKGQEQLVKAWQRTVDILGSKMEKLTKAMEKAIEKGFGMKASGGIVGGSAATGGARGSWTLVGEHEPELVRLPFGSRVYSGPDTRRMQQQAWSSMLNTPRSARGAAAQGVAVQPVIVHQTITLDGRVVAQQIFDPLRKEIANRGGSVQGTLGQGAG
ncbi:hypothetical protein ACFWR9_08765 [Streptomyces sp. NPDC058534]|uniref:hypothetical protein n=1 Tax=Streptomyces sp. NPDC058534 TaxID=3346541 RepID=UPI003655689D